MSQSMKTHWEKVYQTKSPNEVSWTQETPTTSLKLIQSFQLKTSAKIIDVGGGDSNLVDHLLERGFENITVLDISEKALEASGFVDPSDTTGTVYTVHCGEDH